MGGAGRGFQEKKGWGAGPFGGEGGGGFEDGWGVGEEGAIPEVGAAAFEDVNRILCVLRMASVGGRAPKIEAERGTGFVFAVKDNEVVRVELGADCGGELGGA